MIRWSITIPHPPSAHWGTAQMISRLRSQQRNPRGGQHSAFIGGWGGRFVDSRLLRQVKGVRVARMCSRRVHEKGYHTMGKSNTKNEHSAIKGRGAGSAHEQKSCAWVDERPHLREAAAHAARTEPRRAVGGAVVATAQTHARLAGADGVPRVCERGRAAGAEEHRPPRAEERIVGVAQGVCKVYPRRDDALRLPRVRSLARVVRPARPLTPQRHVSRRTCMNRQSAGHGHPDRKHRMFLKRQQSIHGRFAADRMPQHRSSHSRLMAHAQCHLECVV